MKLNNKENIRLDSNYQSQRIGSFLIALSLLFGMTGFKPNSKKDIKNRFKVVATKTIAKDESLADYHDNLIFPMTLKKINEMDEEKEETKVIIDDYSGEILEIDQALLNKMVTKKKALQQNSPNYQFNQDLSISNTEKIAWILQKWNLTYEEFMVVAATCWHEGGPSYIAGYTVINNVFNRINSYQWAAAENQRNLYYQITRGGQYSSYLDGYYLQFLDMTPEECPAFQAIIDFLYTETPVVVHDYRSFSMGEGYRFFPGGDGFTNPMPEDDYISTDLIWLTEDQLGAIAEAGGFANYFTSALELEPKEEKLDLTGENKAEPLARRVRQKLRN